MKRALVLENSRTQARLAMVVLRSLGYGVERYDDIMRAESACDGHIFDLYLVDVAVFDTSLGGEGDGLAFAAKVMRQHVGARVIIWSVDDHRADAEKIGARFVQKDGNVSFRLQEMLGT